MVRSLRVTRHHPRRVISPHPSVRERSGSMEDYEIRVRGRVSPALLARFEGMRSHVEPVETVLHVPLQDQAALHGMIALIRSLGLELIEVRKRPGAASTSPTSRRTHV